MASRQADALTRSYQEALRRLRLAASTVAVSVWDDLPAYNEADAARFIAAVAPRVDASSRQAVNVTAAYLARFVLLETRQQPEPVDVSQVVARDVPPEEVWRRPFVQLWGALARQTPWQTAANAARARVAQTAVTDVQLATRNAANLVTRNTERVTGYRRVLGFGKNCPLCTVASTQHYTRDDLLPIHPGCGCTVEPLLGEVPDLSEGVDVTSLPKVEVVEHGELGPVLWDASHDFTDLAA